MIAYQQRMATVADAIADGDLTISIAPVSDNDRLATAFTRMLNNLRSYVLQLETFALTDGLTQTGNLRAFRDEMVIQLSSAARLKQSISLVLLDIDEFKAINDIGGHQQGDTVLARLGSLLKTLRAHDRAYRLGGDEFAVILPSTCASGAKVAMERLRREAPRQLGVTLSFGIATCEDGNILIRQLIE
jgi:diguanylate cyclase (GGDEF)-like protein